ncbi:putative calpain-like cysteine peptidase [Trypanosoma conorhini]|uniref:Putative calpain-like cysteine peptidase n=1 Tax=Trypanosoma conorhini TaxID=83891 RepID=A0A422N6F4_9TRYP|nr:putative calpain-like cysteine peptidase [Trypanosoma conorhini]RNF01012.1 putative calpain-like cysteine peptidase [Trypanosoma conorhini]
MNSRGDGGRESEEEEKRQESERAEMTSPVEIYRAACAALEVPPNSGLLRIMPASTVHLSGVRVMHLGRNFLGDRGVVPLLSVLAHASSLHTLNLRDNGVGNDGVRALCRGLRRLPALKVLELSGNPFTFLAARRLVHLCEESATLTVVGVEGTLMTETLKASILRRIHEAVQRREKRKQLPPGPLAGERRSVRAVAAAGKAVEAAAAAAAAGTTQPSLLLAEDAAAPRSPSPRDAGPLNSVHSPVLQNPGSAATSSEGKRETPNAPAGQTGGEAIASALPPLAPPPPGDLDDQPPAWLDEEDGANNDEAGEEVPAAAKGNAADGTALLEEAAGLKAPPREGVLSAAEEVPPWQASKVDATLTAVVSIHTPVHSFRRMEKPAASASATGYTSSFSLEVRAAEAEGKLLEFASTTAKEDDFLDLLFGSEGGSGGGFA